MQTLDLEGKSEARDRKWYFCRESEMAEIEVGDDLKRWYRYHGWWMTFECSDMLRAMHGDLTGLAPV